MKADEIKALFYKFEQASQSLEAIECWSARELRALLGYSKWGNFSKVVDKAKESCENAGQNIADHFPDVRKMVEKGKGTLLTLIIKDKTNNSSSLAKCYLEWK